MQNFKFFPRIICLSNRPIISLQRYVIQDNRILLNVAKRWSSPNCIASTNIRFVSSKIEDKMKKIDNIPDNFKIIYRAPLYSYVLSVHGFNFVGVFIILATLISKFYFPASSFAFTMSYDFIFGSSAFLMLLGAVSRILYIYILRIYTDEKGSYIIVKSGIIPFIFSKITFSQGEIVHLEPKGIMPWQFNRYTVNNQSAIILEHYFRKPSDYNTMLSKPKTLKVA